MKKSLLYFTFFVLCNAAGYAQGTLQFNQGKIISNTLETVPSGKIWKVTAVYGEESRINECVNMCSSSTHELRRAKCSIGNSDWSRLFFYSISAIVVNGVSMPFRISGFADKALSGTYTGSCDCTGSTSASSTVFPFSCANLASDPNLLPMWLPAGTTFKTGGPNTFASVIEFNIVP